MARKRTADLKIDWNNVEALAQRQISLDLIARSLGLTPLEFQRAIKHFKGMKPDRYLGMHQAQGQIALIEAQYQKAIVDKHAYMQKWLGIQHLGQRQRVETLEKPEAAAGAQAAPDPTGFTFVDDSGKVTVIPGSPEPAQGPANAPGKVQSPVEATLREEQGQPGTPADQGKQQQGTPQGTRSVKDFVNETGH